MRGKFLAAAIIFLIIAAAGAIGSGVYSNGFESFSSLYIAVGDAIYTDDAEISFETMDDIAFEVKSAGFGDDYAEFSVNAVLEANDSAGIYYRSNVTDKLITLTDTGFTLTPISTPELITSEYPAAEFSYEYAYDFGYTVTVTKSDGKKEINLTFDYVGEISVYDLKIDPNSIIF